MAKLYILFDDYFHQATVKFIESGVFGTRDMIERTNDHENEIGTTEHFIDFFFKKMQEYAFKYTINGSVIEGEYKNDPRGNFSQYAVSRGRTFQQAAASTAALLFGKSDEEVDGLMDCFSGLMARLSTWDKWTLYTNIDNGSDIGDLEGEIENIWAHLEVVNEEDSAKGYQPIGNYLTREEFTEFKACFKSLLFPLLCFAGEDNGEWDQDILGTLVYNIPRIISNHYPEVTHAWLRSYDCFYANDTAPVTMAAAVKTAPSAVTVEVTRAAGGTDVCDPQNGVILVKPGDLVRLVPSAETDRNAGEAIYYQFTSGKASAGDVHAFAEPFRLMTMLDDYANDGVFTLQAVAAHNGKKLAPVTITLELDGDATFSVPENAGAYTEVPLTVGQSADLHFYAPNETETFQFKEWKVYSWENGTRGAVISPDKYVEYFGSAFNAKAERTTVANLAGISARFEPAFDRVVHDLTVRFYGAANQGGLPSMIDCREAGSDTTLGTACPISWAYHDEAAAQFYIGTFSFSLPENIVLAEPDGLTVEWKDLGGYRIQAPSLEGIVVSGHRAQFTVAFSPQGDTGGNSASLQTIPLLTDTPEDPIKGNRATVKVFDLNTNALDGGDSFTFYSDNAPVRVSAPVVENMEFMFWYDTSVKEYVREAPDGGELIACYCPVVNEFKVTLAGPLAAGERLPDLESMTVTVSNVWRIDSARLTWVDAVGDAAYDTAYTARISLDMDDLTGTNLSVEGSESQKLTGAVAFAKTSDVVVTDRNGTQYDAVTYLLDDSLWIVFEKTAKQKIVSFAPVDVAVPYGSERSTILAALPDTAYAYLENGRMIPVDAEWNRVDPLVSTPEGQTVSAYGEVQASVLETCVVDDGAALTANVTVLEAEKTTFPFATPSDGEYQGEQTISLTADEGARIRYALVITEEGADFPGREGLSYQDYTEPFTLTDFGKTVYLFTYAEKDGLQSSSPVCYTYHLKNAPVPTPGGRGGGGGAEVSVLPGFADVPAGAYYSDAVDWAVEKGVTNGTDETHFSPDDPCTRAQMVTFLWRAAGEPGTASGTPFTDVPADAYYTEAVAWAVEQGVTKGTSETTFSPDDTVTRGQVVTFLWRYEGEPEAAAAATFTDVSPDAYYADAVSWAAEKGVTTGVDDTRFAPDDDCVRAQIVTFLYRDMGEA